MNENNLYDILNIDKNASQTEIKKSYKKLAVKIHPDKHNNDNNYEKYKNKFIKIKEAFDILSDKEKRKKYDKSIDTEEKITLDKKIFKIKSKNIINFIKNPIFYLLFFDSIIYSDYTFINSFLIDGNITKILDINKNVSFTIYEYYNCMPKLISYKRITRDIFIENIFAIDNIQLYEKEGEIINIDGKYNYGNLVINIKITDTIYKNEQYYIIDNDVIVFIKKPNIIKNKIKLNFLDNKIHVFKINELKKFDKKSLDIYYIENMGLPYFNTKSNEINNINSLKIKRGKLFFMIIF